MRIQCYARFSPSVPDVWGVAAALLRRHVRFSPTGAWMQPIEGSGRSTPAAGEDASPPCSGRSHDEHFIVRKVSGGLQVWASMTARSDSVADAAEIEQGFSESLGQNCPTIEYGPMKGIFEWLHYRAETIRRGELWPFTSLVVGSTAYTLRDFIRFGRWLQIGLPSGIVTGDRFELLDQAIDAVPLDGLWLEFGVWKGHSINHIAQRSSKEVFGFDSFEGLPEKWQPWIPEGTFSLNGKLPSVVSGVKLIKGRFSETLPGFLEEHAGSAIAFLHVDSDSYRSARFILEASTGRIVPGTVVVFDEFCGLMPDDESRAWREFCRLDNVTFSWLGCSFGGAVALVVRSTANRPDHLIEHG